MRLLPFQYANGLIIFVSFWQRFTGRSGFDHIRLATVSFEQNLKGNIFLISS